MSQNLSRQENTQPPAAEDAGEIGRQSGIQLSSLFLIAHALTNHAEIASQVVSETLSEGLILAKQKSKAPNTSWMVHQILQKSHSRIRRPNLREVPRSTSNEIDRKIWPLIESADWRERLVYILQYCLEWQDAAVANMLGVSEGAVKAQQRIFEQHLSTLVKEAPQNRFMGMDRNRVIGDSIRRRFEVSISNQQELEQTLQQFEGFNVAEAAERPVKSATSWMLPAATALSVLVLCLAAILFVIMTGNPPWQSAFSRNRQPTATQTQDNEAKGGLPLTWLSSPVSIRQRMLQSSQLWQTMYVDVQITDFGPASYIGAPRLYRLLAWVRQPAESIQLFGLLSQAPNQVYVLTNGHSFELNPVINFSSDQVVPGGPGPMLENETLRRMVFPATSNWSSQEGTLRVYNTDRILERDMLVVDWYNPYGQHEVRIWIDTNLGFILRVQEFGGQSSELLLKDTVVTEIILDQSFPPTRLASAMQKVSTSQIQPPPPAVSVIQPTPTPAISINQRQSIIVKPLPVNYNLPASQLFFQFSNNLQTSNAITDTAKVPAQLFADSYLVTETKFGLPWMLRCRRSTDGFRLAYTSNSDGTSVPSDSLVWLDLRYPEMIYEPFPQLRVQSFAFSPDSTKIAAYGYGPGGEGSGIFIIDLAKVENRPIISLLEAQSLVWSPDGESLAMIGKFEAEGFREAAVIHVRTGQIAFRAPFPEGLKSIPESWPMSNWGVPFPQPMGRMDDCSRPIQN